MKLANLFLIAIIGLLLTCCEVPNPDGASSNAISLLEATRSKMLTTPTHHYRFTSFWDNRFATSTYEDTMDITYSYLPDSELGFGLYVDGGDIDYLYDGNDLLKINHTKRIVVGITAAEIGKDTNYFANKTYFHLDPKVLPDPSILDRITDTIINGKPLFFYTLTTYSPSGDDPDKDVVATREYYLDPEHDLVDRIRNITHIEQDTVQIIDYFFSDYVFEDKPYQFGEADGVGSLAYRELSNTEDKKERKSGLIRPGAQLHRADYTDIDNQKQLIYGKAGKKTLAMFSFIGCAGCEYALREMKKKEFAVKSDIDLIYTSSEDDASALHIYFKKKGFPFTGFDKSSKMNANFKVASFPTFVLINEQGGVERVIGGYDEEVAGILFE